MASQTAAPVFLYSHFSGARIGMQAPIPRVNIMLTVAGAAVGGNGGGEDLSTVIRFPRDFPESLEGSRKRELKEL